MTDFAALNAAVSGLHAHTKRIDVISQNIANLDTPGYHRQVTDLESVSSGRSGLFSGPPGEYGGVQASVRRQWDQILDGNAKREHGRASSLDEQAGALGALEAQIGSLADGGLADRLQTLFNGFDDLANNPKDLAVRNVVLGDAEAVASVMNTEAVTIDIERQSSVDRAATYVDQLNGLAATIADLDRNIAAGVVTGDDPNGLIDQRDRLATELAGLVDAQIHYETDGQIRVSVDGHNLVGDGHWSPIRLTSAPDATLTPLGYERVSLETEAGRPIRLHSGAIHGSLAAANDLLPEQRRELDAIAVSLTTAVNALHVTGTGLDGVAGRNLFDPAATTALTFAVSADVAGEPSRLAASDGSGPLDNTVARGLAELGTDPTGPAAQHGEMLAALGNRVRLLDNAHETASLASGRADEALQNEVGVALDEELADLMSAQRAYEASARMISAIDEMLDTLINRTGLVGR